MSLEPGFRLGNLEIRSPLGAGGMGEVYLAHDLRLDRPVAIKALPAAFAADPARRARFEREARLLAAVHHPNIAAIHGLEDAGGASYLVLEFVEGDTLARRLAGGPLPPAEALAVATQVAAAIEAAHERGVVHRDLKPGNVMLGPGGGVKVLDFGLAKGAAGDGAAAGGSMPPTFATAPTAAGMVLGTAPYMSPEQARGREVDRRTDVWAFGCLLYECLTGRQAFAGETSSDVIARILERDPDWDALAPAPARLRDVVRRCLTKDLDGRPRDMGDLRRELQAIALDLSAPGGAGRGGGGAGPPSLAVLYFENLAQDPDSEYFCAGITEDILTDLSKIKGLRVASRNAVARYRGTPADIAQVAAELGVRAVLEGSVRRAGNRVRITAQLIQADGFHLWAERYDRTLEDVFAVQEEIASAIAAALEVRLTAADQERIAQAKPGDVRAYDLYLQGREHYGRYTPEDFAKALRLFEQAIELDPDYALAHAGVADVMGQMLQYNVGDDPDALCRRGLEAARRAIALKPRLPEGHKAEALVLRFSGDVDGSRAALERAVQADPRFAPALLNLAVDCFSRGDLARNESLLRRALEIDPQDQFALGWLAGVIDFTGRPQECAALLDRLLALATTPFYRTVAVVGQGLQALRRGDPAAALECLHSGRSAGGEPNSLLALEAAVAAHEGRLDDARRLLRECDFGRLVAVGSSVLFVDAALRAGEVELAERVMARPVVAMLATVVIRLVPEMRPLADRPAFAPRRCDISLVWPLEAAMIEPACHALFREVRIESGLPEGSSMLGAAGD